jgi:NAD(P)-dependent dehydrogenase (short-subunit alcohol dehydrogenase family)
MNQNPSYSGKAAFVTGAANGIGRATALAFAREGASVVVADVSEAGNQETARMIEDLGGRALPVRCDVSCAEEVKAALASPRRSPPRWSGCVRMPPPLSSATPWSSMGARQFNTRA